MYSHGLDRIYQFNNLAFCDDLTLFAQGGAGMQQLLNAIKRFERWSGIKVSLQKIVAMVLGELYEVVKLKYKDHDVPRERADNEKVIKYLGSWSTKKGDLSKTKEKVFSDAAKDAKELMWIHIKP